MVMPLIHMEAILGRQIRVQIARCIPIQAGHRSVQRVNKGPELLMLVVLPGGKTGFGDPDFCVLSGFSQQPFYFDDLIAPAPPVELPRARKAVQPDNIDRVHHSSIAHQSEPVQVRRTHSRQDRLLPQSAGCACGRPCHFAVDAPFRIESPVPIIKIVRLIPEFYPIKIFSEAMDGRNDEIRERSRIAGGDDALASAPISDGVPTRQGRTWTFRDSRWKSHEYHSSRSEEGS